MAWVDAEAWDDPEPWADGGVPVGSPSLLITRGFGSFGSAFYVAVRGLAIEGAAPPGEVALVRSSRTVLWAVAPSPSRIHAALTGAHGGTVVSDWRLERRSLAGEFIEDISLGMLDAWVELNNDRDVKRQGQVTFDPALASFEPLSDYLYLSQRVLVDGEVWVEEPLGLFVPMNPRKEHAPTGTLWTVDLLDIGFLLAQATTTQAYTVAAGTNYITAAAAAIVAANSSLRVNLAPTTKTLPVKMTWPAGTPWMKVLTDEGNGLLDGIDYYQAWADRFGVIRSREREDLSQRSPDVTYTGEDYVTEESLAEEVPDVHYNRVVALAEDPTRGRMVSIATNADPNSPISTVRTGRVMTRLLAGQRAADQATLDKIARRALRDEATALVRLAITTVPDPRRDAHEVYSLTVEEAGIEESNWRAQSWRLALEPGGPMKHSLTRTASLVVS